MLQYVTERTHMIYLAKIKSPSLTLPYLIFTPDEAKDGMFQCRLCKKKNTMLYQLQTRRFVSVESFKNHFFKVQKLAFLPLTSSCSSCVVRTNP